MELITKVKLYNDLARLTLHLAVKGDSQGQRIVDEIIKTIDESKQTCKE